MNNEFDELTKGLAQSATRRLAARRTRVLVLGLMLWTQLNETTRANELRLGPLIDLSDPDVLIACGSNGREKEPYVAVNPANPKNIATAWYGGGAKAIVTAASLDGGRRWQQVVIPGLTLCSGGTFQAAFDPWLTFTRLGDLYAVCTAGDLDKSLGGAEKIRAILVTKSTDGGLHWNSPLSLDESNDPRFKVDKPSVTADPTDARYIYAVWRQEANGNRAILKFARSSDAGRTWEPFRQVFDPGNSDQVSGPIVVVLPDGTLVTFFIELLFSSGTGGSQKEGILSLVRSTDKGQSWSAPVQAARVSVSQVTDPDTGTPVTSMASYPTLFAVAVDQQNGHLYAVWEDTRFSNGQYTGIAFSMSGDGGVNWSEPIAIHQTPASTAPGNNQAFLPSVAVAGDGTIGVTYYDFRFNDLNPGLPTDHWLVHCHPSATALPTSQANWVNEVRLTNSSFDLEAAPIAFGGYFIGDHEGLAAVGNDFLATWSQPVASDANSVFFRRAGP